MSVCLLGRPQVRWEDGYTVATNVSSFCDLSLKGQHALSIASQELHIDLQQSFGGLG